MERVVSMLKKHNLSPRTVIDVGVAYGTPWLYEGFPDAHFHLVDPTRESLPHMKALAKAMNATIHNVALGENSGTMEIAMRDTIIHATFLKDVGDPSILNRYQVDVKRFDELFPEIARPAVCKIDVEGAEMMVLKGMGTAINSLDAIVIETSFTSLYEGGPEFGEVVQFMSENGLAFYDYGGVNRRPYDDALHQIDAVFVPKTSALRVRRWS
jgi:FkbM family methyltransferase